MNDEFENALAWFCSAPMGWIESGRKNLAAGAEWIWEVVQGDFNEKQSTAQVVTGTIISMIPLVDQVCDVRDLAANCKKIKEEPNESSHIFSLVLTLIGLFPSLGSLLKGCLKVGFASTRKAAAVAGVTPSAALKVEQAAAAINRFLARSEVIKALKALNWDNPRKILAAEIRKIAGKLNSGALLSSFNQVREAAASMLNLVQRYGGAALAEKAGNLLKTIDEVRRLPDSLISAKIKPAQDFLSQLARRLEIDGDMAHRAYLDAVNPHAFVKITDEIEEAASLKKKMPTWVDQTGALANKPLRSAPSTRPGWPNTRSFDTFHTMQAVTIPPGTKLYRIVDPTSRDNSICWMTEAEFMKLRSKDEWRRRFAVWAHWNSNGEFVTYTVPPGSGLNVWEGITASQNLKGTKYVLEGGARQIIVDPAHLDRSHVGARQKTGWGYDDLGTTNSLVGVPVQKNKLG
jgi:hypothetical protein